MYLIGKGKSIGNRRNSKKRKKKIKKRIYDIIDTYYGLQRKLFGRATNSASSIHKHHNHHTYYYLFATILKAVNTSTTIKTGFYKTTRLIL